MTAARLLALVLPVFVALSAPALRAQEQKAPPGYPQRDALTPFRNPQEIAAPPDELFAKLRTMRRLADDAGAVRSFDAEGREVVDDPTWREMKTQVGRLDLDAGMLAGLIRNSRNADDRATAFYAAFYCANIDHVFNLIGHIPGEPERSTRERAYPRAIEFLRAHIGRTFGELPPEQQAAILRDMPEIGSPVAKARGITRLPKPSDLLFTVNLVPFYQLLDLDDTTDQAQSLWFLKEAFKKRRDLAVPSLEPVLPRLRQLLAGSDARVREEAIGLLLAIGPKDLQAPAKDAAAAELDAFADRAIRELFPPIRRLSDGLMALLPSPERDAIQAAGKQALDGDRIGEGATDKDKTGKRYRGFRVDRVPDELALLGIPKGAIVTAVNGVPVFDGRSLLQAIGDQFVVRDRGADGKTSLRTVSKARLFVEYMVDGEARAQEYRVL